MTPRILACVLLLSALSVQSIGLGVPHVSNSARTEMKVALLSKAYPDGSQLFRTTSNYTHALRMTLDRLSSSLGLKMNIDELIAQPTRLDQQVLDGYSVIIAIRVISAWHTAMLARSVGTDHPDHPNLIREKSSTHSGEPTG